MPAYLKPKQYAELHKVPLGTVYWWIYNGLLRGAAKRPSRTQWSIPADSPLPSVKPPKVITPTAPHRKRRQSTP